MAAVDEAGSVTIIALYWSNFKPFMSKRLIHLFFYSAGALLLFTGAAKLIGAAGDARILNVPDPLLLVRFRHVFLAVGTIETVVACFCLQSRKVWIKAALVGWLSLCFMAY